jgi:hypothetical protein
MVTLALIGTMVWFGQTLQPDGPAG